MESCVYTSFTNDVVYSRDSRAQCAKTQRLIEDEVPLIQDSTVVTTPRVHPSWNSSIINYFQNIKLNAFKVPKKSTIDF